MRVLLGTLIERWRKRAVATSIESPDSELAIQRCADELEAALATPPQQGDPVKAQALLKEWIAEDAALPPTPPQQDERDHVDWTARHTALGHDITKRVSAYEECSCGATFWIQRAPAPPQEQELEALVEHLHIHDAAR